VDDTITDYTKLVEVCFTDIEEIV